MGAAGPLTPEAYAAQGDQVIEAEEAVQASATAELEAQLRELALAYLAIETLSDDERSRLAASLRRVRVTGIDAILRQGVLDARDLGAEHGTIQLGAVPGVRADVREILAAVRAEADVREQMRRAAVVAEHGGDPPTVLGVARHGLSITGRRATWGVNAAHSAGVRAVADVAGAGRLWIAERDACLHCAAYAGIVAWHQAPFPTGLTYAAKPLATPQGWSDPPLHPNCRCRIVAWRQEWGDAYPLALEREARRSVARGFSLPSESERSRLRAADELLRGSDAGLPKTVAEYGRASVRAGRFRRGRRFPG